MSDVLNCPKFYKNHFIDIPFPHRMCSEYWYLFNKYQTLSAAIENMLPVKSGFACSALAFRCHKRRTPEVEFVIAKAPYAARMYVHYMQKLHQRGELSTIELLEVEKFFSH